MTANTIYNKFKGLASLLAIPLTALLLSGCSDFLEIEPRTEIVLEKFWTEKADVDGIVAGCYSGLQSESCIRRMIIWGEARSDNMSPGTNIDQDGNLMNILNENITAKNGYTSWVDFYNVINRCNTVIKYAPQVASIDPGYTDSELNATIAEMTALRSLCYFYLIRTFCNVPFSREAYIDDDQEMDLPASTFDQVLDSLIFDLESVKDMALKRYPTTKPEYQTGRITQDAIYSMLCEMYLWKQDYNNCIRYADLVIESKKLLAEEYRSANRNSASDEDNRTNGFPLLSNLYQTNMYGRAYNAMFTTENYLLNQQEIIFQLIFSDAPRSQAMLANSAVGWLYGSGTTEVGYLAPSDYIFADIDKTSGRTVFDDKTKKWDGRMYLNCSSPSKSIKKYGAQSFDISVIQSDLSVSYGSKWPTYMIGRDTYQDNGSNWIIYRLSDIMLLKAEALSQLLRDGSEQEVITYNTPILEQAFTLVNAVNKRSHCQSILVDTLVANDYLTKEQMQNLVMRERQRELMFEGKRWYDLVRRSRRDGNTTVLTQAALQKVSTGSALIGNKLTKMDAIYWPYNFDELKVNKNLVQNPAFSSGENESYE